MDGCRQLLGTVDPSSLYQQMCAEGAPSNPMNLRDLSTAGWTACIQCVRCLSPSTMTPRQTDLSKPPEPVAHFGSYSIVVCFDVTASSDCRPIDPSGTTPTDRHVWSVWVQPTNQQGQDLVNTLDRGKVGAEASYSLWAHHFVETI